MDRQKRFLASTLQGALDADVLTRVDLYRHMSAEILAQYIPPEILWEVVTEGMRRAQLGFSSAPSSSAGATMPATPILKARREEPPSATEQPSDDEEGLPFEMNDDEMPPIPDDDAVVVEDVDWDDDDKD